MMSNLTYVNYLNLVGFIVNVLGTFAATPIFHLPDTGTISAMYQTLITPSNFTFAIWGIIFFSQLIFTIAQMIPHYCNTIIIQESIKHYYFYACVAQSAWQFAFGYEVMWIATLIISLILAPLYFIVDEQLKISVSIGQFWLFKFPVSVKVLFIFFHKRLRY
jgi:hypothetical protein